MNRQIFWLIVVLLVALFMCRVCGAGDTFYGVGIFGGGQWNSDTTWKTSPQYNGQEFQFRPSIGKHLTTRWDMWLEGELGYIRWAEGPGSFKTGILLMTDYDVIRYRGVDVFVELGGGIGYNTYSPNSRILGSNPIGLIDYGCGITYKNVRFGPRFHHTSSIFGKDTGINSYGMLLTIRF